MPEQTELTNTISFCLTLLKCGGPCHLSSFKQCSGDLIFLQEQFVHSVMGKINISEFVLLILILNTVNIKILRWNFFKTAYCTFECEF